MSRWKDEPVLQSETGEPVDKRGAARPRGVGPKIPLTPEQVMERMARMTAAAKLQRIRTIEDQDKILHSPTDHLDKFKRAEWDVVSRYLADKDTSVKTIAAMCGYKHWQSVQKILNRPHVKALIEAIRAKQVEAIIKGDFGAQALLKQSQVKAAQKVVETIDSPTAGAKTNLAAAESVLDRTGLGKASAIQHHHVHEILRHFSPEELQRYGDTGEPPARFAEVFKQLAPPTDE